MSKLDNLLTTFCELNPELAESLPVALVTSEEISNILGIELRDDRSLVVIDYAATMISRKDDIEKMS